MYPQSKCLQNLLQMPQTQYLLSRGFLSKEDLCYQGKIFYLTPSAILQLLALSYDAMLQPHIRKAIIWISEETAGFIILSAKQLEQVIKTPATLKEFIANISKAAAGSSEYKLCSFYKDYYKHSLKFIPTQEKITVADVKSFQQKINELQHLAKSPQVEKNRMLQLSCDALKAWFQHLCEPDLSTLEISAENYFQKYFTNEGKIIVSTKFEDKQTGKQAGCILNYTYKTINTPTIKTVSYHIKTHENGRTWECFNKSTLDLRELLVYYLLSYIGMGPKIHIFSNTKFEGDLYIALQDLRSTKVAEKKKFLLDLTKIETSEDISYEILKIEIIQRILRLTDVLSNTDNYAIVCINDRVYQAKVVDFTIAPNLYEHEYNPKLGFQHKAGLLRLPPVVSKALSSTVEKRRSMARTILAEFDSGTPHSSKPGRQANFENALQKAEEIVSQIARDHVAYVSQSALQEFELYCRHIKENYNCFRKV